MRHGCLVLVVIAALAACGKREPVAPPSTTAAADLAPRPEADPQARKKSEANNRSNLDSLARIACLNPDAVTQAQLDAYLYFFPNGLPDSGGKAADHPRDCHCDLFLELMNFNAAWASGKKVQLEWIIKEGHRLKNQYEPPPSQPQP